MIGAAAAVLYLEGRRTLRRPTAAVAPRLVRNVALGAVTAAVVRTMERPIVTRVAAATERRGSGILPRLRLSPLTRTFAALALMDYTLYWWHVLLHRVPVLWRLHEPHHADRDLDASTALRFHFLEFIASIPWRCAQITLLGVSSRELALWQRLTFAEVIFHHSNVRLPRRLEAWLEHFVVTPRMHGVHHSIDRIERDSNFSSGLAVWDTLHDTAHVDRGRDDVIIGLAEYGVSYDETFISTLAMPFVRTSDNE